MFARVSTYKAENGKVDDLIAYFDGNEAELDKLPGFRRGELLVDRATGEAMTITFWDSAADVEASAARASTLREAGAQAGGAPGSLSVHVYEVIDG